MYTVTILVLFQQQIIIKKNCCYLILAYLVSISCQRQSRPAARPPTLRCSIVMCAFKETLKRDLDLDLGDVMSFALKEFGAGGLPGH